MRTLPVLKKESSGSEGGAKIRKEMECLLVACRVCLITDTKLYNLHDNQLAQTFGDLTGTPVSTTDGLPQHICNVCSALLQKSAAFRAKCRQTHIFLQDIRVHTPCITTEYVRNIDKTNLKLPLTTTNVLSLGYVPNTDHKEKKVNTSNIKKEYFVEIPPIEEDCSNLNTYLDDAADAFLKDDVGEKNTTEEIKLEEEFIFVSNTEPYPLRGTRSSKKDTEKAKVKEKKTTPKRVKTVKKDNVDKETQEPEKVRKKAEPKKKRIYNRKTEEDFVSFSKNFNCDVIFLTREQQLQKVQSRKESEEYLNARFQCTFCYKSFMNESAYNKHMHTHDPTSGSHVCDICHVRFPARHKLMNHLRRHKMHFICKSCHQISKDSTIAKMHFKWHEGFKYECQHCGKFFNKPSTYMNHVRENHTAVTCEICQESVSGTRGLAAHKTTVHSESYKCAACGFQFNTEAALARHWEICDPCLRPCPQCGENFVSGELVQEHLETQHKFRCELCNASYSNHRMLAAHWGRMHKPQGSAAGSASGSAPNYKYKNKNFMCEVCAKSFQVRNFTMDVTMLSPLHLWSMRVRQSEAMLRYHQSVHTGEKPFPCPMCPKRFRLKIHLQVHINTHTGERPYKCPLCPEAFKSFSQKYKHRLLVHTKERRYKCTLCPKTYVLSCDLKMHVRTVHMKIPRPPPNRRNRPRKTEPPSPSRNSINM